MLGFQQRRRLRNILYSKATLALLLVALVFFVQSTFSIWRKERETARETAALARELSALSEKETTLSARVGALKTARGVEEAIREKFKVAKEGEGVVVVVDQSEEADTSQDDTGPFSPFFKWLSDLFK